MLGSDSSPRFPDQRWQIASSQPEQLQQFCHLLQLHPLLAQVLLNRSVDTLEAAQVFLNPELQILPSPLEAFEDLPIALELLLRAIADRQFIAICGDYDADGMTSTALLLRALRFLGAIVDYAIPSRMQEGYGINRRIIEDFHQEGVGLILTVDNGIAAHAPIAYARELGMAIIVTDHHDIPPTLPNANAILNPKLIRADSPYRGVAGVGVAYILAICLAQSLQKMQDLTTPLIELFTLGTIADLAPLTGVNRRWVKRGLKLLPKSKIPGVQALIQVAGLSNEKHLKPEAIGFRLGPRINAIGRISDPQIVIELLTTDDDGRALELAMKCEQVNQLRQRLCELIEQEALAWCIETGFNPKQARVLVIVQPDWHHGVIGIVASRLVERYGVPVFIGTFEEIEEITEQETKEEIDLVDDKSTNQTIAKIDHSNNHPFVTSIVPKVRGSARGIPEFDVFEALQFCSDLLEKFGGHQAAGGFTLAAENLEEFRLRLEQFAHQSLRLEHLKPLVKVDVQAQFRDLTLELYERMDTLHPCGIENPDPVFWTPNVHIVEQRAIGQNQAHLKLTLAQIDDPSYSIRAMAWRWGTYYPLPDRIDIAYRLRLNEWNGTRSVELELIGVRLVEQATESKQANQQQFNSPKGWQPALEQIDHQTENHTFSNAVGFVANNNQSDIPIYEQTNITTSKLPEESNEISCFDVNLLLNIAQTSATQFEFYYSKRKYTGDVYQKQNFRELRISNLDGQLLIIQPEQRKGFLSQIGETIQEIDVSQPHYFNLVRSALTALELAEKGQLIREKEQLIAEKDQQIALLHQQLDLLKQQLSETLQPSFWTQLTESQQEAQQTNVAEPEIAEPEIAEPEIAEPESIIPDALEDLQIQEDLQIKLQKPTDPKQRLRLELGEQIWNALDSRSQKDLVAASKKQTAIQAADSVDYSDVGLRLCSVIEREVIQPFFREIHRFLLENEESCEIGGVTLRARKKYTLGMLPPLLAAEWQSFQEEALSSSTAVTEDLLSTQTASYLVELSDRDIVQAFLSQWEHPLAFWLQHEKAASTIAQIDKLLTIAADAENILHDWQLQLLQLLILGTEQQAGILQQIYHLKT